MSFERLDYLKKKGILPAGRQKTDEILHIEGFEFRENIYIKEKFYQFSDLEKNLFSGKDSIMLTFIGKELILKDAVFFDLETTGLSTGSGCVAFLAGLAFLEEEGILFRQYFLHSYAGEKHFLEKIAGDIDKKAIISFNGKAYDLNLLKSRIIFQNTILKNKGGEAAAKIDFVSENHIDLLHISRRFFGKTLASCSLKMLEKYILDKERFGDIDGSLVPLVYFDFLKTGNQEELQQVFLHNEIDVLSMVSLLSVYVNIFKEKKFDRIDIASTAKHLFKINKTELACEILSFGASLNDKSCKSLLSFFYKKNGEIEKSVKLWNEEIEIGKGFNASAYEEIAKYYEHRERDYKTALETVKSAINKCEILISLDKKIDRAVYERFLKRKERLLRKLLK